MPNARKKKAAKMEDFKKKKLKVGKQKQVPDSFTDTSFHSKSISLPNQSISEDKSHEITTSRNLTLIDLVTQLRHYNSGVKKEALSGLTDLCNSHPTLLVSSLSNVVNGVLKLFVDEDREVRKATRNFLKETFVDVDPVELQPFMSLLIIYTCSAMTHIFEDIRLDAVKLMDLWLDIAPDAIVSKFWTRVTGNYMSLLQVDSSNSSSSADTHIPGTSGNTTTASVKAAVNKSHLHIHKSKLSLFTSLSKFLQAGLAEQNQDNYWFLLNYLSNRHSRQAFKTKMVKYTTCDDSRTVKWSQKRVKNQFMPAHIAVASFAPYLSQSNTNTFATFSHLHLFESSGPKNNSSTTSSNTSAAGQTATSEINNSEFSAEDRLQNIQQLIETFQPILVVSWLEAAPSVFVSVSSISMTPALELLHETLRLSLVLWRAMVSTGSNIISKLSSNWLNSHLQQLLKHFTVYFPFGADSFGNRGVKVDDMLQEMNIMLCELTSLYLLARTMQRNAAADRLLNTVDGNDDNKLSERQKIKKRKLETTAMSNEEGEIPEWAETVVDHVLGVLGHNALDGENHKMTLASSSFKAENLISLLPAIWGFLNCLGYEESIKMFGATLGFYNTRQPGSSSKKILLDFIIRAYMIQSTPSYNGQFVIVKHSALASILKSWMLGLPKLLWQLRSGHVETSRAILNVMCDTAKRSDQDIFELDTLIETEKALVPFFFVNLQKGPMFGPFKELPSDVQQRALDYVQYLDSKSEKMAFAIDKCSREQQNSPIGLY